MKGLGSRLCSAMYAWIADITASTLRKTPRRIACVVMSRKNRSTMLSHDELVGCKMHVKTRVALEPSLHFCMLVCPVIIGDDVDVELLVDGSVNQDKKLKPLAMSVPLHARSDDRAVERIERGE